MPILHSCFVNVQIAVRCRTLSRTTKCCGGVRWRSTLAALCRAGRWPGATALCPVFPSKLPRTDSIIQLAPHRPAILLDVENPCIRKGRFQLVDHFGCTWKAFSVGFRRRFLGVPCSAHGHFRCWLWRVFPWAVYRHLLIGCLTLMSRPSYDLAQQQLYRNHEARHFVVAVRRRAIWKGYSFWFLSALPFPALPSRPRSSLPSADGGNVKDADYLVGVLSFGLAEPTLAFLWRSEQRTSAMPP